MYWSFILIGIGMLLLTGNWLLGGGFLLIIFMVMFIRMPVEERALLDAYGQEYADYAKRTGKFFPKVSSLTRS
jgi:protein-S-isoprenylcysteine O-methyltransferase Ste14